MIDEMTSVSGPLDSHEPQPFRKNRIPDNVDVCSVEKVPATWTSYKVLTMPNP
jgi:hypothetical protein